jgi:hypothetical protein
MLHPVTIEFRQYCGLFSLIRLAAAIVKTPKTAVVSWVRLSSLAFPKELVVS